MKILLASPRGFCAGVDRAIAIVERALDRYGAPVYVRHQIVHNRHVVDALQEKGAIFVDDPSEVPVAAPLIFSAHGVSPAVRDSAARHQLDTIDATCPLVTKVHAEVKRMVREGYHIIMIGHAGHVEVEGTMGQAPERMVLVETVDDVAALEFPESTRLGCVTQTTLSVDDTAELIKALREKFPNIVLPRHDDICYATQNRQDAVKALTERAELVLIVGAPASSNSNRLVEVAAKRGIPSYLIQNADEIDPAWLDGVECAGVSAGASTPEFLVEAVVDRIAEIHGQPVEVDSIGEDDENVTFKLPIELRAAD